MNFTEGFRKAAVKKILMPGGKSVIELSKEIGVSTNALYNWKKKFQDHEEINNLVNKSPRQWKTEDKVNAVFEAVKLNGENLGRWLREKGLHSDHIKIWESEIKEMASSSKEKAELRAVKKENQELKKDLRKKEKALAEVTALLVLKKKMDLLFADEEK